jgi:hypothetical protein
MTPAGRVLAGALALGLVAAACGDDDDAADTADTEAATPADSGPESSEPAAETGETTEGAASTEPAGSAAPATDEAVCPSNMVIQVDWWPEVEHGGTYQLMGDGAEADASLFTYSGPIDPKYAVGGIETLEIRAGGDAIEFQPVSAVMMTDQDIVLGYVNSDDAIFSSGTVEVTGVAGTLEINPQMLMWDPEQLDIDKGDPTTMAATGAPIYHFPTATYFDFLVSEGYATEDQSDPNYGGAPDLWVAEGGNFIQQGFATNEVYKYENELDWKDGAPAPVDFFLIHDLGWQPYPGAYSVLTDRLEELGPCLEVFVPMLQQAWVDFLQDPGPVGDEIIGVTEVYNNYWQLSPELNDAAYALFDSLEIGSNGPDDTYGNFDTERMQGLYDALLPIMDEQGVDLPEGFTADSAYTNEFIDESIGL